MLKPAYWRDRQTHLLGRANLLDMVMGSLASTERARVDMHSILSKAASTEAELDVEKGAHHVDSFPRSG